VFQGFDLRNDGGTDHRCSGWGHSTLDVVFEVDHVELLVMRLIVTDPTDHQARDAYDRRHQCRDHIVQRVQGGDRL